MAAHADDLRYFYAEDLGDSIEQTCPAGVSTELRDEKLEPGRYVLRILDFGGGTAVWVQMGETGNVVAQASTPSTRFNAHANAEELNKPLLTFMVRAVGKGPNPPKERDMLAFFTDGGTGAIVSVTKVSRGKS